jgi:hypothetical protein
MYMCTAAYEEEEEEEYMLTGRASLAHSLWVGLPAACLLIEALPHAGAVAAAAPWDVKNNFDSYPPLLLLLLLLLLPLCLHLSVEHRSGGRSVCQYFVARTDMLPRGAKYAVCLCGCNCAFVCQTGGCFNIFIQRR